jgi:aspartate kinase
MQVFKFGGASVKDAASVRNVSRILSKHTGTETIVVISAMDKITNKLEELVNAYYYKTGDVNALMEEIRRFHTGIAEELFPEPGSPVFNDLNNIFVELSWAVEEEPAYSFDHHYDQVVCQGEILSTRIVSAFLSREGINNQWLDARGFILTDDTFREGKVDYQLSERLVKSLVLPAVARHKMVTTQGFIGGTAENFSITLGREGSDYTAGLLAYFTDASRVIIWKDVPGVLNADPRYFRNTRKIDELSYHDAIELTYYGASVIHPKTIKPLQNKKIPLFVRSFLHPEDEGTVIRESEVRISVPGYIFRDNQVLLSIQPRDFSFIEEDNLSMIFAVFSAHRVHISMMQHSAISFSACADLDKSRIEALIMQLGEQFRVLYNENVQLLTIRNYDQDIIGKLTAGHTILVEQRSRFTYQAVFAANVE